MLHYYFFKYWSRGLVGIMITIVVGYFGVFSYALFSAQRAQDQVALESAQLSATPPLNTLKLVDLEQSQKMYQKSLKVFEGIQDLKVKNQDTTKLETMYADSVKNLSSQNQKVAATQLQELETQIAKINDAITPTPQPSGELLSGTPSPSISPSPSQTELEQLDATSSARILDEEEIRN